MYRYLFGLLMVIIPFTSVSAGSGKKPQWVTKGTSYLDAQRSNTSYHFVVAHSTGNSIQDARNSKIKALGAKIANLSEIEEVEYLKSENKQGEISYSTVTYTNNVTNRQETKRFYHEVVDEYWEWEYGAYNLYTLFAVSDSGKEPVFDHFSSTTSYGATPVLLSIIPGVGQMYKGSTAKGICMLAGVAACSVGALFCENERSDYKNKMKEQPQFAQQYNTKANNYETARNICIGAAAAVWLYNIIDAAVAKGARRIVISPARNSYWSLHPVATPNSAGLSLAYNF